MIKKKNQRMNFLLLILFSSVLFTVLASCVTVTEASEATEEPEQTTTQEPEPPAKIAVPQPPASVERINFVRGTESFDFTTTLSQNKSKGYLLWIRENQEMTIKTTGLSNIEVLDTNNSSMPLTERGENEWHVSIPENGTYTLIVAGEGSIEVFIHIPAL